MFCNNLSCYVYTYASMIKNIQCWTSFSVVLFIDAGFLRRHASAQVKSVLLWSGFVMSGSKHHFPRWGIKILLCCVFCPFSAGMWLWVTLSLSESADPSARLWGSTCWRLPKQQEPRNNSRSFKTVHWTFSGFHCIAMTFGSEIKSVL